MTIRGQYLYLKPRADTFNMLRQLGFESQTIQNLLLEEVHPHTTNTKWSEATFTIFKSLQSSNGEWTRCERYNRVITVLAGLCREDTSQREENNYEFPGTHIYKFDTETGSLAAD